MHLHNRYPALEETNKRYTFIGLSAGTIGTAALMGGGIAAGSGMFGGKKKSQNVPDPLAGLRAQLQGLAGAIPGYVAKQKELTAARMTQAKTEGMQGINENIRAERGFGNSSLQDRLNTELLDKLTKTQNEANLASDIWGTQQQASILQGTAGMYPDQTQQPEEPSWINQLLGMGTNLAVQNWMDENKWKNIGKYLNPSAMNMGGGAGKVLPGLASGLADASSGFGSQYMKFA